MTTQPFPQHAAGSRAVARPVHDRRRHKRISVTLLGRFMRSNKRGVPTSVNIPASWSTSLSAGQR
jgi:hypothetical protein